jgi:glutamyl-tRNA synthetase
MPDITQRIEAHALANAIKYDGKANTNNVLPKIIGEFPDAKKDIQGVRKEIEKIVAAVNALGIEAQRAKLERLAPELLERKPEKRERDLPPLPNAVDGKVVTRIPPEPSKYNHIGHALTFLLNAIYAERYHGKVIVRFEDANPEKVTQEYTEMMLDDITNYLGIKPAAIRFVSDDMPQLYAYAAQLIERDGAYMCFCDRDTMSKNREEMRECDCRRKPIPEQLAAWEELKAGKHLRGEAVLRFKGDMASQNTVLRDPVLFRAVAAPHFRQGTKYKAWPTYDFYSGPEEVLCGVTHVLRSNEFELRIELQNLIKQRLGLPEQEVLQYGRFQVTGATTQGREIREGIAQGQYTGWDDPRLVTLKALKRRGIRREAYTEFIKQLGLSPYAVNIDFTMIAAANRKFIEDSSRYAFVADPVRITVEGAEPRTVELDLHPSKHKGGRVLSATDTAFIAHEDIPLIKGKRARLMGNLTLQESHGTYTLLRYEVTKEGHDLAVQWVPADDPAETWVMMPDATLKKGFAEPTIRSLRVDDIVQFERFGFCRLDAIEDGIYKFWYTHK